MKPVERHRVYTATGIHDFPDLGFAAAWLAANPQVARITKVVETETEVGTYGTAVSPPAPTPPADLAQLPQLSGTAVQYTRHAVSGPVQTAQQPLPVASGAAVG